MADSSKTWIVILAFSLFCGPTSVPAEFLPEGGEFPVNTYTTSSQRDPAVAGDGLGNFVAVWTSFHDGDQSGIFAQRYGSGGAPLGVEFQVNSYTTGLQYRPNVAASPAGDFVVTWNSDAQDGNYTGVFAQRFGSAGNRLGSEFQVNTVTIGYQNLPAVAVDGSGRFLVAWSGYDSDGPGVIARRYDSSGAPQGAELQVNTYETGYQDFGDVTALANGFVVLWSSDQNSASDEVFARFHDSAGIPFGSELQVNTYTTSGQFDPHAAATPDGGFVAVWGSAGQDGDGSGRFGQRLDSAGSPLGSEFQVNTYTMWQQAFSDIATNPAGDFVVTWQSYTEDGSHYGIFARSFLANGDPDGDGMQVNEFTSGVQISPQVAGRAGGGFAIVWVSEFQDGSSLGVFGRRYRTADFPLTGKKLLIRTPPSGPSRNKLVYISADPGIELPPSAGQDPRCAPLGSGSLSSGARLRVTGLGGDFTIDLPCLNWSANSTNTRYRYKDATGATCKRVILKDGRLQKAVCKGAQVAYNLGVAQGDVSVVLATGDPATNRKYCATFGPATGATVIRDGSDGKKYKAVGAGTGSCP